MKLESKEEIEAFKFMLHLCSRATDRVCNDLSKEELNTFKKLKILRADEVGKPIIDDVKYDFDIPNWLSGMVRVD